MEQLLQQAKYLDNNIDSFEKLQQFESIMDELQKNNPDSKTVIKLTEKIAYHRQCLENKEAKYHILNELQLLVDNQSEDLVTQSKVFQSQFNQIGYAGKNTDELLSREFKQLLDVISEQKHVERLKKQSVLKEKIEHKKALIEQAKKISQLENFNHAQKQLNALFDEWKAIGFSGKEDDILWEAFNKERQNFFARKAKFYEELKLSQEKNAELKKALIEKTAEIVSKEDYSNEITSQMKQIDVEWKAIKNAGKDEEKLWSEFSSLKEKFWTQRNEIASNKFAEFKTMIEEIIARKNTQLQNVSNQILDLRGKIGSVKNDEYVARMQTWISEKEEIVAKLQKEINSLTKKITKN